MKKYYFIAIIISLNYFFCNAQNEVQLDTIHLKGIDTKKVVNNKIKTFKPKGKKQSTLSSQFNSTLLTKIKTSKCISINTLSINLEEIGHSEDDRFELLLYTSDNSGKPHEKINNETTYVFNINKNYIKIDLSNINHIFCSEFFIGFKKIEEIESTSKYRFLMRKNRRNILYFERDDGTWFEINGSDFDYVLQYKLE